MVQSTQKLVSVTMAYYWTIWTEESKFDVYVGDSTKRVFHTSLERYYTYCLRKKTNFSGHAYCIVMLAPINLKTFLWNVFSYQLRYVTLLNGTLSSNMMVVRAIWHVTVKTSLRNIKFLQTSNSLDLSPT